jgi:hypothetical protein
MKWFKEYAPLIVSMFMIALITFIVKYSDML